MKLTKCDHCKRLKRSKKNGMTLEDKWAQGSLHVNNPGIYFNFDLCEKCSPNVVRFLKKYVSF